MCGREWYDKLSAVSYVKVNGWISSSRYAELYKVPMRTSSRELGELAHKGVFVLVGKGRQSRYELKSNRARIAPIAPNCTQGQKPPKNKEKQDSMRKLSPQTSKETTIETTQETTIETTIENLREGTRAVYEAILSAPTNNLEQIAEKTGMTRDGVFYHVKVLRKELGLHHEGPTKKGRWVFGPNPKGNRHEK